MLATNVPFRLDRLPWSRWHWLVVGGLGITWILDGLEVTVVGAIGPRLQDPQALGLSAAQVGGAVSAYLAGAVLGALIFGYLTDALGRKRLFMVTLVWYLAMTVCTAFAWNFASFAVFRFLAGMGIGGEYSAINSAIDELIPARRRGWTDLAINGSWWFGTIIGSAESIVFLDPRLVDQHIGWRLCFASGALLAVAVLLVRRFLPESPRWLLTHGRMADAERIAAEIEAAVRRSTAAPLAPVGDRLIVIDPRHRVGLRGIVHTMLRDHPQRSVLALSLMITQAFLYNAIFFSEALVLKAFFGVPAQQVGYYIFPFAVGNLLGPIVLGHLFDGIGRRASIAGTYIISGALLTITGLLFTHGALTAKTITACWCVIFFFASAGASGAYLTASEIFPVETRAMAIAVIYAAGTLVGGGIAPPLFGALIESQSAAQVFYGYLIGAACMIAGGLVELALGVDGERKSLEEIAPPLSQAAAAVPSAPNAGRTG